MLLCKGAMQVLAAAQLTQAAWDLHTFQRVSGWDRGRAQQRTLENMEWV